VDEIAKTFVNSHIVVGTEVLVTLFRCAVAEKKIKHDEIEFLFKEDTIKVDKNGTCNHWPKDFCGVTAEEGNPGSFAEGIMKEAIKNKLWRKNY